MTCTSNYTWKNFLYGLGFYQVLARIGIFVFFIIFHLWSLLKNGHSLLWLLGVVALLGMNVVFFKFKVYFEAKSHLIHREFFNNDLQRAWMDVFGYCIILGVTSPFWCKYVKDVECNLIGSTVRTWHCVALLMTLLLALIYYIGLYKNAEELNNARHIFGDNIGYKEVAKFALFFLLAVMPLIEAILVVVFNSSLLVHFDKNIIHHNNSSTYVWFVEENIYILIMVIVSLVGFIKIDDKTKMYYIGTTESVKGLEIMKILSDGSKAINDLQPLDCYSENVMTKLIENGHITLVHGMYTITDRGSEEVRHAKLTLEKLNHTVDQLQSAFLYGNLPAFIGFLVLLIVGGLLLHYNNSSSAFIAGGTIMQMILGNFTVATALKDFE